MAPEPIGLPFIAGPSDEQAMLAYFDASPDETIWLRCGLAEGGARFALLRSESTGPIVAIGMHDRNGVVRVHAGVTDAGILSLVARACVRPASPLNGVAGPPEQVEAVIAALGLGARRVIKTSSEIIMSLEVDKMIPPALLAQEGVVVRRASAEDLPLLIEWRLRYSREVHQFEGGETEIAEVKKDQADGRLWVLEDGGAIVNTACFSAVFPEIVQVEYAYGPPELRAKKYGRSVVAGALLVVQREGIRRAVFNTAETNVAVQTGIQPIGFRTTARFWVVLFDPNA